MNKTLLAFAALILGTTPALAHNGVIHEAPHGGIMKATKTSHLEIVLAPQGGARIYFMDASGKPLPASAASDVSVEIDRPGQKTEYITMRPDPTGTLWTGNGKPANDPKSVIRIGSVVRGESELIEVPRSQFPVYGKEAPAKGKTHAH
ncbi:hypothetical protein Q4F19_02435 [Sphingomonas sp. BIUV-7]|uniref:Copper resistance protein CopC n=1 Tax=Sphingomonas natans TaxID=3063330 RepID=A0ABT8Y4I2_9SPHN|nr:hypothetical protein [Sphingomonas sp. BIUV-7]MDO6413231.1 hypothetical protein [Sphingomonas sp. BIUV-7]